MTIVVTNHPTPPGSVRARYRDGHQEGLVEAHDEVALGLAWYAVVITRGGRRERATTVDQHGHAQDHREYVP